MRKEGETQIIYRIFRCKSDGALPDLTKPCLFCRKMGRKIEDKWHGVNKKNYYISGIANVIIGFAEININGIKRKKWVVRKAPSLNSIEIYFMEKLNSYIVF